MQPVERLASNTTVPFVPCDLVRWLSGLRHSVGSGAYRKVPGVRISLSPPSLERSALARQAVLKTVTPKRVLGVRFSPSPPIFHAVVVELADTAGLKSAANPTGRMRVRISPTAPTWTGLRQGAGFYKPFKRLISVANGDRHPDRLPISPICGILFIVTDEELAAKTALFNQTLMQYGRAKALHSRLGTTMYEDGLLDELDSLLKEIQTEIGRRRRHEEKEQATAGN